jgi:DNA-binding CsgD family transcriptional regulator
MRARAWRAQLLMLEGQYAVAEADLESVLIEQRMLGDPAQIALSLVFLGHCAMWRGAFERAKQLFDEALPQLDRAHNRLEAIVLNQLAVMAWQTGEAAAAAELAERLWGVVRAPPQRSFATRAEQIRALVTAESADTAAALRILDEATRHQRRIGDHNGLVDSLFDRGQVLLESGDAVAAHAAFAESTRLANESGLRVRTMRGIEGIARSVVESRPDIAVQLAAAATESRVLMMTERWPRDNAQLAAALGIAHTLLGAEPYARAWSMGAMLLERDAVGLALTTAAPARAWRSRSSLTPREREVLQLFARGRSPQQIAEELVLSVATVRTHLDRATAKLDLHSRVELANWGIRTANPGLFDN